MLDLIQIIERTRQCQVIVYLNLATMRDFPTVNDHPRIYWYSYTPIP